MAHPGLRLMFFSAGASRSLGYYVSFGANDSVFDWTYSAEAVAPSSTRIDGESDPEKLADVAQGNAHKKRTALVEALRGRIRDRPRTTGETRHRSRLLSRAVGLRGSRVVRQFVRWLRVV